MSKCIHTIYKNGKLARKEIMPNKGYGFEDRVIPEYEKKKTNIWEARREMSAMYNH